MQPAYQIGVAALQLGIVVDGQREVADGRRPVRLLQAHTAEVVPRNRKIGLLRHGDQVALLRGGYAPAGLEEVAVVIAHVG